MAADQEAKSLRLHDKLPLSTRDWSGWLEDEDNAVRFADLMREARHRPRSALNERLEAAPNLPRGARSSCYVATRPAKVLMGNVRKLTRAFPSPSFPANVKRVSLLV